MKLLIISLLVVFTVSVKSDCDEAKAAAQTAIDAHQAKQEALSTLQSEQADLETEKADLITANKAAEEAAHAKIQQKEIAVKVAFEDVKRAKAAENEATKKQEKACDA